MSSVDERKRGDLGPHWVSARDEPILRAIIRGELCRYEAATLRKIMYEHGELHGGYPFVAYVQEMTGMDTHARQIFVRVERPYPFSVCIIVGAGFAIRTAILGVYRAGRALLPHYFQWPMVVVKNEQELQEYLAREWFNKAKP